MTPIPGARPSKTNARNAPSPPPATRRNPHRSGRNRTMNVVALAALDGKEDLDLWAPHHDCHLVEGAAC